MRERMRMVITRGVLLLWAVLIGFAIIICKYNLSLGITCLIISVLSGVLFYIDMDRARASREALMEEMEEETPETKPEPAEDIPLEKSMVLIILIDNYDELISGTREPLRPNVIAQVDTKICDWLVQYKAAWRKHDRDRFFVSAQPGQLQRMREGRFALLDQVRAISVGNRIPPTLSIAVGLADSPGDANVEAREALDVALGRGGDQAVVKQGARLWFYGGSMRASGRRVRVKARLVAQAMRRLMEECDSVTIISHSMPDFDSFGAALGVASCAKYLKKPVHFACVQPMRSMEPLIQAMRDLPEFAELLTHKEPDLGENDLLVVVDTQRPSFTDYPELVKGHGKVMVIDHHMRGAESMNGAVLSFLEPSASSTSEMVAELSQYFDDMLKLHPLVAEAMLAGITVDTKHFAVSTGVRTFEAAAHLKRIAGESPIARELFREDFETIVHRAQVVCAAKLEDSIAISECPQTMPNPRLIAAQSADQLLTVRGIDAAFVLYHQREGMAVSGRSLGKINAQRVLERMGGGGSRGAAGAQMMDVSPEAARAALQNAIAEEAKEAYHNESDTIARRKRNRKER